MQGSTSRRCWSRCCGASRFPRSRARTGVRVRWLWGDLDHLWITWRDGRQRAAIGRSRGAALRAFLRSFFDGSRLEVERAADLAPAWRELRSRIG